MKKISKVINFLHSEQDELIKSSVYLRNGFRTSVFVNQIEQSTFGCLYDTKRKLKSDICFITLQIVKMKLFESSQKQLALLDIEANQSPLNGKNLKACLQYGLSITSALVFLFLKANSFWEYMDSIFICSDVTTIAICFIGLYYIYFIIDTRMVLNKRNHI